MSTIISKESGELAALLRFLDPLDKLLRFTVAGQDLLMQLQHVLIKAPHFPQRLVYALPLPARPPVPAAWC